MKDAASSNTTMKSLDIGNKRCRILKLVKQLHNVQTSYMPCLLQILEHNKQAQVVPEELKLWLSSDLDSRMQKGGCLRGVVEKEQWLWEGQCADTLSDIHASLQTMNVLQSNHSSKSTGQKYATCMQGVLAHLKQKCNMAVAKYWTAREALVALDPEGNWQDCF